MLCKYIPSVHRRIFQKHTSDPSGGNLNDTADASPLATHFSCPEYQASRAASQLISGTQICVLAQLKTTATASAGPTDPKPPATYSATSSMYLHDERRPAQETKELVRPTLKPTLPTASSTRAGNASYFPAASLSFSTTDPAGSITETAIPMSSMATDS